MPQLPQCWFLQPETRPEIVVRRTAAIGDSLAATCVAAKLVEIGYRVRWQCHPDLHAMARRIPTLTGVEEPTGRPHVNLDGAYESHARRKYLGFSEIFVTAASNQLTPRGVLIGAPTNCAPVLTVRGAERELSIARFAPYPQPWVMFAARSNSHANRTLPDSTLSAVAATVRGTCFWLANHANAPEGFVDLNLRSIDDVILALSAADLFVGPDTGPMHIAAALRIPVIALEQASSPELHLSDQRDFLTVRVPHLTCLNCQQVVCPLPVDTKRPPCTVFDPALLSDAINVRLAMSAKPDGVSCVIPTFRAPTARLNKCLAAVLPQVDEVIITRDAGGTFPPGIAPHPKVRFVTSPRDNLGYGRNANFGVRHTRCQWVLLLNDDCYLAPDAVSHLLKVGMSDPRIGLVGHLLRYPDGRICHGGKIRAPGHRGWALLDNRRHVATIREPRRLENVTGTSVLMRRTAFYAIDGFDEDYNLYNEDDAMSLALQQAGWHIWYTPHATGIHDEAATTAKHFNMSELLAASNKVFERKWGQWLTDNMHRTPNYL